MDKFFKRHKLPKFIQEEIDYLNISMSIKEVEFMFKNLPTKKIVVQRWFYW